MGFFLNKPPASGEPVLRAWYNQVFRWLARYIDKSPSITSATYLADYYYYPVDCTSAGVTVTLPLAAQNKGKRYLIKKTDSSANAITIARSGSDTFNGATSLSVSDQYGYYEVYSDGVSEWVPIATTFGAPLTPSFVTMAATSLLPNERVLTAGSNITITDNGAGGTVVIAATSGGGVLNGQLFTSSGTFTKPTNVESVWVTMVGAGGGGGGSNAATSGGGGGGAGEYILDLPVYIAGDVTVTINAAGTGGAGSSNGTDGGTSEFGIHVAKGGLGGVSGSGTARGGAGGGVGGNVPSAAAAGAAGAVETPTHWGGSSGGGGGTGAAAGFTGGTGIGFAGAGGGTSNATQGGGGGGASTLWGAGGAGGNAAAGPGGPGTSAASTSYGAGGGGAGGDPGGGSNNTGGNGCKGMVLVQWIE